MAYQGGAWLVLVGAALSGVANAQTALHHWKFDEAGGPTAFDSIGSAHGALVGSPAFIAGGASGNAIKMATASGDLVTMGSILPMTGGTPFALSAWVKTAPGHSTHNIVAGVHTATVVAGYFLAINAGGGYGKPGAAYLYQSNFPGAEPISTTAVNDGAWHHIVGVHWPGVGASIYVDGAPAEGLKGSVAIAVAGAPFVVGGLRNTSGALFSAYDGLIDDVQVYSGGMCGYDVQWLFDHPGQTLPPIVCYPDCEADCDLDIFDFLCFQNLMGIQDPYADCEEDGDWDVFDFLCFQSAYAGQAPYADIEEDGDWDIFDFLAFQDLFFGPCT